MLHGAAAGAFFGGGGAMWGGLIGGLFGGLAPGKSSAVTAEADVSGAAGEPAGEPAAGREEESPGCKTGGGSPHSFVGSTPVLMADGSSKPISQVEVGDQVSDSVPGDATLQSHTVQKVIVTQTDRDFVDLTVKPLATKIGQAAAGLVLAAAATLGAAGPASAAPADASTLTTTYHHPFYDITRSAFVDAVDLQVGDQLQTADGGTAQVTAIRPFHQTEVTYDLTIAGLHTYFVLAGTTPVLVHNCDPIPESTMNHVLHGDVNEDGEFGGWHMHPGNDPGGYPEGRYINGTMVTRADGSVKVRGTVGAYDPETFEQTPKSSIGHTFFPEGWGPEEIRAAGEDLFANGKYSHGGTRVEGAFNGVGMLGFLEKGADGLYSPSTFFPVGG